MRFGQSQSADSAGRVFCRWVGGRPPSARAVRCYRAVPVNDTVVVVGERSVACEAKVEVAGAQP